MDFKMVHTASLLGTQRLKEPVWEVKMLPTDQPLVVAFSALAWTKGLKANEMVMGTVL